MMLGCGLLALAAFARRSRGAGTTVFDQ